MHGDWEGHHVYWSSSLFPLLDTFPSQPCLSSSASPHLAICHLIPFCCSRCLFLQSAQLSFVQTSTLPPRTITASQFRFPPTAPHEYYCIKWSQHWKSLFSLPSLDFLLAYLVFQNPRRLQLDWIIIVYFLRAKGRSTFYIWSSEAGVLMKDPASSLLEVQSCRIL